MDQDYKKLIVWQKSIELVVLVYALTGQFPKDELYGLGSQMKRAAVSVPSNIAEGSRRKKNDGQQFLRVSFGSASELETQLVIAERLSYGQDSLRLEINDLLIEVLKMLNKMIQY